jgi:hypothetical protein
MRVGDLVRFKLTEHDSYWKVGLLMRYDKFLKIGEVLELDRLYYVPGRLIEVYQRGLK